MEMKLVDGDYVPDIWGGFERVTDGEEILQRVLFKLRCRKGGFAPLPEIGSRLYLLGREKAQNMSAAARQYIFEALADEDDIEVNGVSAERKDDEAVYVRAEITYKDGLTAAVVMKQG